MELPDAIPAAAGLLLALAAGAPAAPISPDPAFGAHGPYWTVPADYHPQPPVWGFRHAHHSRGLDLQALWSRYGQRAHGTTASLWGLGRLDGEYPLPARLCGGTTGAGPAQDLSDGLVADAADDEGMTDDGEGDRPQAPDGGPDGLIADQEGEHAPMAPAVPEPGSLAMLGAGILGILAARAVLRR